ncbi:hypothetical protein HDU93_001001 [Gonapodya sp. JEL0774]|nr:hypothetical protein HDU93_001001 [Gonapodya sp. JEL0774]
MSDTKPPLTSRTPLFPQAPVSSRAQASLSSENQLGQGRARAQANEYDELSNPSGIINLGVAENRLMWKDILEKLNSGFVYESSHLQYPPYYGTEGLRTAIAAVLNSILVPLPNAKVSPQHIVVTNGCGSAISVLASVLADQGQGVLVPAPYYGGFRELVGDRNYLLHYESPLNADGDYLTVDSDLEDESGVKCIGVNCDPEDKFRLSFDRLDQAYHRASAKGVHVRALLICSPNNPLGNCYARSELVDMMRWCAKRRVSFVSDEIYAGSWFGGSDETNREDPLHPFVSVLAIDSEAEAGLPKEMVHVLWGLSKDFNMNGLRGDQSELILVIAACRNLAKFHGPPLAIAHPLHTLLTTLLSDTFFLTTHTETNKNRLRDMYGRITGWLRERKIGFLRANAGFFLWVDFRKYVQKLGGKVFSLQGPVGEEYYEDFFDVGRAEEVEWSAPLDRSAERELAGRFLNAGVYVAHSEAFYSRDMGWFRIVYATDDWRKLELALSRMWTVLQKIDLEVDDVPPAFAEPSSSSSSSTLSPVLLSAKSDPLTFSHLGINATDPSLLVDFYTNALGFTVTDTGFLDTPTGRVHLTFTSRSPKDHHQIVIASGKPKDVPFNVVNQISLDAHNLPAIRRFARRCVQHGATDVQPVTHGNAISVYLRDPEGNRIEIFMDTPWYINQPHRVPIPDFDAKTDVEVMKWVEEHSRENEGFVDRELWVDRMKERMGV